MSPVTPEDFYQGMQIIYQLWHHTYALWISKELFSFSWFVILISIIGIYTTMFIFIDRSRLREIIFYGSLLTVSFGFMDVVGTTMGFWAYKTHFLPLIPSLLPVSYTLHPILHLLGYQYTNSWKSFAIVNTLISLYFAFVAQPIYVWAGILWLGGWTYLYSFITTMGITFFARAVVIWLANIEQKHATQPSRESLFPKLQPALKQFDKEDDNK
ncbi:CBO0543 family protein [Sporomusa sp.]|uniref:CBO0543 family protein n=1 Tax=Sporomusa sp. TaxID=2078658 RepID=UPI002BFC2752|nr:CBO0543 family protein [Sporomusa sp.]HWR41722.1 CBO0543 family protein [Sporomusa sp.]